jgi:uncharacterized membrane protein YphA (DoxX/SURF4 family)
MSCATIAGTGLIPLFSRIVLGAGFFFAGWHACFDEVSFTQQEIRILEGSPAVPVQVSLQTKAPPAAAPLEKPAANPAPAVVNEAASAPEPKPAAAAEAPRPIGPLAGATPSKGGVMRAAAERITLQLREGGVGEYAEPLAWAAAVASLVGGALLFVGLLSRLWAFAMAVMLGASFWFASVVAAGMFSTDPFMWTSSQQTFHEMFATLAFFVLAVGILMTGPGVLSIDGVIRSRPRVEPSTSLSSSSDIK